MDDFSLFSFKNLNAVMQAPDLLNPGRKARHWNKPANRYLRYLFFNFIFIFLEESEKYNSKPPAIEV